MKHIKSIIVAAGLVGLVACFLPFISEGPVSLSLWDFHKMPAGGQGLLNGPHQVYLAFVFFGVPVLLGLLAIATKQLARWEAIVAGVFSLLAFSLEFVRKGLTGLSEQGESIGTAFGGKLLFLAALAGVIAAAIGTAKPQRGS